MSDLDQRIKRLYAAINQTVETDLFKFTPTVTQTSTGRHVKLEFSGGLSSEAIENQAHLAIHSVAHFPDHLLHWAGKDSTKSTTINAVVAASPELLTVIDLANNDKHGYPPRNGGRSGLSPVIKELRRVLQAAAVPGQKGAHFMYILGQGVTSGKAEVVITGPVVDGNGKPIGDLQRILGKATAVLEGLVIDLGLK